MILEYKYFLVINEFYLINLFFYKKNYNIKINIMQQTTEQRLSKIFLVLQNGASIEL